MKITKKIKKFLIQNIEYNDERNKFQIVLNKFDRNISVLEVGCGYGRNLLLLKKMGFVNAKGIDVNPELVKKAKLSGVKAFTVGEDKEWHQKYDLMIFSHIIEHFQYKELKQFFDDYIYFCNHKSKLIISTPTYNKSFYNDFDHVKPYHPYGILMVYSKNVEQVQFNSNIEFHMNDFYFYKEQLRLRMFRSLILNRKSFAHIINGLFQIIYNMSRGKIGETTGWIGVFSIYKE